MNNKQDFFKTQSCVLRVNIHCDGCRSKVKKILQKIDGVYTISIDAELGKVTVTGTVDPSTLIKKLEKNGKHAQLWGPPPSSKVSSNHQFMNNLNNQFKNLSFDAGGKMVRDNKSHNGGKDQQQKIEQPQQGLHQQQVLQQQQQQLMQLQQQMSKGGKDGKAVKFSMPVDEEFDDDDEFDDGEFDDEFDDDEFDDGEFGDEEFDDDVLYAKHPPSKNAPMMGNVNVNVPKGGSGGGDKKGKRGGGGGGKKKGGGGGMAGLIKGMLGGGGGGKGGDGKGKDGKKDGKSGGKDKGGPNNHVQNGGKNGSEGKKGEGKMGKEENFKGGLTKGGGQNGNSGKGNGNGGKNKGGGGGGAFKEIDGMSSHNKSGGPNMSMMGQMGNYPMGSNMPSIPGLPAAGQPMMNGGGLPKMNGGGPHMMNGGGGGGGSGYYPGMGQGGGPVGPSPGQFNNPQQYMAMMMNQQRMNGGGDGYGGGMYQPQPVMYGRQPMGVGYAPPMVPPPGYHDPYTSYYSGDENHESCSIM